MKDTLKINFKKLIKKFKLKLIKKFIFNTHFINITKAIFISGIVSLVLILVVYAILPKTSWINLQATTDDFTIIDFTGEYILPVDSIYVNGGFMENMNDISISLGDEFYILKPYELKLIFPTDEEIDQFNISHACEDFPRRYSCVVVFDKTANIRTYSYLSDSKEKINLQIKKLPNMWFRDNDFNLQDINEKYGVVMRSNQEVSPLLVLEENTLLETTTKTEVYIKNKKIEIPEEEEIKISPIDKNDGYGIFALYTNSARYGIFNLDEGCYFEGSCINFYGSFTGRDSLLKQTYQNTQKEFDIGLLEVKATGTEEFQLEYGLSNLTNNIKVSGQADMVSIAGTSLNFNFTTLISENLGAIISAIFTSFIAAYIPMVLTQKTETISAFSQTKQTKTKSRYYRAKKKKNHR